jgi:osmotically-inducible protein OsmY
MLTRGRQHSNLILANEDIMKTDLELQKDVATELAWDPSIRHEDIAVAAKDGVITLGGVVDSYAQLYTAERAAARVLGVRGVANELTVKLDKIHDRSDSEIAHAAVAALRADIEVPDQRITVKVTRGFLSLQGEVNWQYQRNAAERAVRYLAGVKGIVNNILVAATPTRTDVKKRIEDALNRAAELDAGKVMVEIEGHRVTLRGTVRSLAEKNDASRAAWAASGVNEVVNLLTVEPFVLASV